MVCVARLNKHQPPHNFLVITRCYDLSLFTTTRFCPVLCYKYIMYLLCTRKRRKHMVSTQRKKKNPAPRFLKTFMHLNIIKYTCICIYVYI